MATIKEVADLAGVAVGTVSHVITGTVPVSEPLRRKVHAAIRELASDLRDTVRDWRARTGYGRAIAAPQLGVLKRVVIVDTNNDGLDLLFGRQELVSRCRDGREWGIASYSPFNMLGQFLEKSKRLQALRKSDLSLEKRMSRLMRNMDRFGSPPISGASFAKR